MRNTTLNLTYNSIIILPSKRFEDSLSAPETWGYCEGNTTFKSKNS